MDLLDIWMVTTIVNFFYRIKINIQTYKTYADLGYIYNHKRLNFIEEKDMETENFIIWFIYKFGKFIPIYNLYQSLVRKFNICIDAKDRIALFEEYNIIEKMTSKEKEEYNKKNTGMYVIKMRRKLSKKRKKLDMVVFSDGSTIFYQYDDKIAEEDNLLDSIVIIEARGSLDGKSEEELRNIVYNSHISMAEAILNNYENEDDFFDKYNNEKNIELSLDADSVSDTNINKLEKNTIKKRVRKK